MNTGANKTVSCLRAVLDQEVTDLQQRNTRIHANEQTPRRINA